MKKYIEELDKNLNQLTDELNNTLISIDVKQAEIDVTNELLDALIEERYIDNKMNEEQQNQIIEVIHRCFED